MNSSDASAVDVLSSSPAGFARGGPRAILRLEGAVVLCAAVLAFSRLDVGWGLFAALFLLPDVSFLGYLIGPRAGAIAYNAAHSYLGPAVLGSVGLLAFGASSIALSIALIWTAHVGFDRMLGYGLKYEAGFKFTHLGRIGRARAAKLARLG